MAEFLKGLLGGSRSAQTPIPPADDPDFADFAGAPEPSPASIIPSAASILSDSVAPTSQPSQPIAPSRPYTKWYRVWERTSITDFYAEMIIIPLIAVLVAIHMWGSGKNKKKARAWITAHAPILRQEFAITGFDPVQRSKVTLDEPSELSNPEDSLKQKGLNEYITYASGRQNVAFVDVQLSLHKRYNPAARAGELAVGFVIESQPAPEEQMQATLFAFDGKENEFVPTVGGKSGPEAQEQNRQKDKSTYDNFIFAIVHKESMKFLRDNRYDLSLTSTKDNPKLPVWATIMSESAEITDTLLTPELIAAVEKAGESLFKAFIVTDQPLEQPKKLNDAMPRKRVSLALRLPSGETPSAYESSLPLFQSFIRFPDFLASKAHFRPEALKRVKATREEELRKIRKLDDEEKTEERRLKAEKEKKEKRDATLKNMSAEQQRKYLEKERASDLRKTQKSRTMKG